MFETSDEEFYLLIDDTNNEPLTEAERKTKAEFGLYAYKDGLLLCHEHRNSADDSKKARFN
ncbi:hypothetical protein [Lactiplantibacillus fabifermentans]|uniref:Uncharacterized protein n=2 Tax=Lactiplantibacillus fabifermentans TaxID=483011 RepID=A0A0R2NXW1_9LACO|nr:hypothetical protein [Lactiplantibacillus fabifermentans]ETY74580.1 hypothetical protein LFAB_06880 [Lactiplantibacillus fabifermentans T30PCM01]KRO27738.1 hypothetical protein DY78_GL002988 [Lactiplantibacillus fabifermentans DSM 21115]